MAVALPLSMPPETTTHPEGVYVRRWTQFEGLFFDDFAPNSAWIKEKGSLQLPPLTSLRRVTLRGELRPHPDALGIEVPAPSLDVIANNALVAKVVRPDPGPWEISFDVPTEFAATGVMIELRLEGVGRTNFLAWAGRVAEDWPGGSRLQRFRRQNKNRQLRITQIEADGEVVYDFSNRHSPYSSAFARKHASLGLNIAGFILADLGVGESARCMLRAADAAHISASAIPLKIPCKARQGDRTYAAFVQDTNAYSVNVFHLDPPAAHEIDVHHGRDFRRNKYNIGYWAWELPEFPDAWISCFNYFDEIWVPSNFVRDAIAPKSPIPVVTMPHAISFETPNASISFLREKFRLPLDRYLFLVLYDLNSYSERKNPRAALAAFRESGLAERGASLVIKVHGTQGNEADLAELQSSVAGVPGVVLIAEGISRREVYLLESACDCFVSLHRSEGFGLALAECMYLGKPVIATDWSAPTEFLNATNGCPVRFKLVTLDRNHGPYAKGQTWAEPDVSHAAEWMRRLFADRALGHHLGSAARTTMEQQFSPAVVGARYRRRREAIASW